MFTLCIFSNRWLFVGVITMVGLQLLFTYAPAMQLMFGTEDIGSTEWTLIIAVGVIIYSVVGIEKKISAMGVSLS